jgi:hypothetical protein
MKRKIRAVLYIVFRFHPPVKGNKSRQTVIGNRIVGFLHLLQYTAFRFLSTEQNGYGSFD